MKDRLYDPIRNSYVLALPEEIVRQKYLSLMIDKLGFSKSLIAVEKDLRLLPHLQEKDFTKVKRRADIISFAKDIHPSYSIYPLLMIECKACKLSKDTISQVLGYNHFVGAYFVSIANGYEIITYWYNINEKKYNSVNFLPSYKEMIQAIRHASNKK
ncbi:MAG: hypothetical protein K1000chlam1_00799 [Candidatus Anoxychlamydiales bacterium]|nr:hypothetical protein [Candidatus Anoxychlamydiales bacterium]